MSGGALMRQTRLGPERIGSVLAGQTRAWCGPKLGVGFYRAGGYAVGFVFRPDRGPLDDRVVLPKIRGRIVDAHATLGDDRAWLWLTCEHAGRLATTCVVIGADASVLAAETLEGARRGSPASVVRAPRVRTCSCRPTTGSRASSSSSARSRRRACSPRPRRSSVRVIASSFMPAASM